MQLDATAHSSSSATVTPVQYLWSSSDPAIAMVNSDGLVTAVSAGSVTIHASAAGFDVSVQLDVSIPTVGSTGNDENVPVKENGEVAETNRTNACPDGQVAAQSNERIVTQDNVDKDNLTSVHQTNEQTVVQNNSGNDSGVTCVPISTIKSDIPDIDI